MTLRCQHTAMSACACRAKPEFELQNHLSPTAALAGHVAFAKSFALALATSSVHAEHIIHRVLHRLLQLHRLRQRSGQQYEGSCNSVHLCLILVAVGQPGWVCGRQLAHRRRCDRTQAEGPVFGLQLTITFAECVL